MLRKTLLGSAAAFGMFAAATAALALTVPPTFAPRMFATQQKHYLRTTFNFNSCVLVSNTCSLKVGAIPVNSFLTDVWIKPTTAFNSGTNDGLSIGITAATTTEILALGATNVHGTTLLHYCGGSCGDGTFAGIALAATNATSTGTDGGFDVYIRYTQTSTAPTAGTAIVILEWIAPNDGSCIDVPLGATSPAVC